MLYASNSKRLYINHTVLGRMCTTRIVSTLASAKLGLVFLASILTVHGYMQTTVYWPQNSYEQSLVWTLLGYIELRLSS